MARRNTKVRKGVESLKKQIDAHFFKVEKDIGEGNVEAGLYHVKEIDKSLLKALELKLEYLNASKEELKILEDYKQRLELLKQKVVEK
jgi:hypothetical protein